TVRVTYIGYAPFGISNIRVSSNTTTTQDFELTSSAVQVQGVEVVAERPLIQRNTTNTVRLTTQENIQALPFRGVENILALQAGVAQQDGKLYVRGGRAGEIGYYVDGANVTNPFSKSQNVSVIQEAIEELQLQSGGFTAEFGGANSAIVRTTVRTGGSQLKATFDYQTDDFAKPGQQFLGTSAFGFRNVALTAGGPVPFVSGLRFYVAGQHNYMRNRQQMVIEPFRFEGLKSDGFGGRPAGELLPNDGVVEFKRNFLYNNWSQTNTIQGTLVYDINPIKLRFTGNYSDELAPTGGEWPDGLPNYLNQKRNQKESATTTFGNLRVTHVLGPETFYEVGVSYSNRYHRIYDPDFGDNWQLYSDSIANAEKGHTGFVRRFSGPLQYSTILGFRFDDPNAPTNTYAKDKQTSLAGTADFVSQITSQWEIKAGGRIESWSVRSYRVGDIERGMVYLYGLDGKSPRSFASADERRALFRKQALINNYGYDVDGNEADGGFDAARKPLFASTYIQNKFEFRDMILNVGVRYEYYDSKNLMPDDLVNPSFNTTLDVIDESKLVTSKPFAYLLPRISFSFPASENTVFYAQYGRYAQLPDLSRLYMGNGFLSSNVSPITRFPNGRGAGGYTTSFLVTPERTTQFEVGIRQSLSDNFAFTLSGFYKHVKDLLKYSKYPTLENPLFVTLRNEDFSTLKGLELTLELRRTNRLAVNVNYTLSDAVGTGSDPTEFYVAVSDVTILSRFPVYTNPLQFNQTHRGQIILDYRFPKGDGGPVLEGMGLNLLLSFNSGHPYTKIKELSELGQTDAWRVGIRTPSRRTPVESVNNSTTPWVFNVDLNFSKVFFVEGLNLELYVNVLNLFDAKKIINVYETTGSAQDDGWLTSPLSASFRTIPRYAEFYKAINLDNRWAYMNQFGRDLYSAPRQIRVGAKIEL
ncbi:MAG: TonB-dependent receptor, partial [Bacteroidota bacterium]